MATLRPFRALRPTRADAPAIAAVPYDVVNADEARALADGNPLSFLRVSRAELELPPGTDPHADEVYERAVANFDRLKTTSLVVEDEPSVYLYRLRDRRRTSRPAWPAAIRSTSTTAASSRSTSGRGATRKTIARATCSRSARRPGPVFLTYRSAADVDAIGSARSPSEPLFDFVAPTACVTRSGGSAAAIATRSSAAFARVPALYIADGHHRAASAARARDEIRDRADARGRRSATAPTATRFSAWRFRTIRCRSCRTTGS